MSLNHIALNKVITDIKLQSQWEDVKSNILAEAKSRSYAKGETIYVQNEQSENVYFVLSGQVKLSYESINNDIVCQHFYGKGEIFGELALYGNLKRRYFASSSAKNTVLACISVAKLRLLMLNNSKLNSFIFRKLGHRQLEVEHRLAALKSKKSKDRIVEFLVQLAKKQGQRVGYEIVVRNIMTHQDIADVTSTSRQSVTTELNELRRKEILKYDRRRLLIKDFQKLESEINGYSYAYC